MSKRTSLIVRRDHSTSDTIVNRIKALNTVFIFSESFDKVKDIVEKEDVIGGGGGEGE